MMYLEDRPKATILAPRFAVLVADPAMPQGSSRTFVTDLPTLAAYLAATGPQGPPGPAGVANCRNARVAIGSGLLAPNAAQSLRVTWATPFADANYTLAFAFEAASLLGGVRVEVRDRKPGWVDLAVVNGLLSLSMAGTLLHVTATHDAVTP